MGVCVALRHRSHKYISNQTLQVTTGPLYKHTIDTHMLLYKAAQVCDVEGYRKKTSFRSTKVQRTKRHTLKHTVYFNENKMKTWLSDNFLLSHLGNLRGISAGRSFKDKHKRNVSLRQMHSLISLENEQEKADDLLDLALVAGQHV